MSIEPKFLKIETRIANPTATSAAATIEKKYKFVLVHPDDKLKKQQTVKLTAFNIISIDINTMIAFAVQYTKNPIQKKYRKENVVLNAYFI
jgi:hypothetical protein